MAARLPAALCHHGEVRGWAAGFALLVASCLASPPQAITPDASEEGDPCAGEAPDGCAFFTCPTTASCYRLCFQEKSFANASAGCEGSGKLLETETQGELDCAQAHNTDSLWIGLVQDELATEFAAGWTWQSTGLPPESRFWDEIEPNDDPTDVEDGEEQCAIIVPATGEWADVMCGLALAAEVCEFPHPSADGMR
jgi:hypothetical protein